MGTELGPGAKDRLRDGCNRYDRFRDAVRNGQAPKNV
jgi:hypothetical protein